MVRRFRNARARQSHRLLWHDPHFQRGTEQYPSRYGLPGCRGLTGYSVEFGNCGAGRRIVLRRQLRDCGSRTASFHHLYAFVKNRCRSRGQACERRSPRTFWSNRTCNRTASAYGRKMERSILGPNKASGVDIAESKLCESDPDKTRAATAPQTRKKPHIMATDLVSSARGIDLPALALPPKHKVVRLRYALRL